VTPREAAERAGVSTPFPTPSALEARLARIEARLAAIEAALGRRGGS
jgi:hypothetical protein